MITTALGISLEVACGFEMCTQFARPLYEQMASGRYDECSVMAIPSDVVAWRAEHKTARKRADRCEGRGYRVGIISRHLYSEDILAINRSAPIRQKRPMSSSYLVPVVYSRLPAYPCERHAVRTYGVHDYAGDLVAYLWLYRAGQLALVSQILGHADHLKAEVMYLLWQGMVATESAIDPDGFIVYNRHDSGTDGLRFYKDRVGLTAQTVEWLP